MTSPLEKLSNALAPEMDGVNNLILERLESVDVPLIPKVARALIEAGGKRIRPLLTLASAKISGAPMAKAVLLAGAIEFIHSATLLHDDVIDDSKKRRGRPSAKFLFGNKPSILVGDVLFARAFEMMVEAGNITALGVLANAAGVISKGEVAQLEAIGDTKISIDSYISIISAKTAALFEAACRAPSMLGDSCPLGEYGKNLGISFQISDDILDYTGGLGKKTGDDFREGKITAPVIYALREDKDFWKKRDFNKAKKFILESGAIEKSRDLANLYANKAITSLNGDCEITKILKDLALFAAMRG